MGKLKETGHKISAESHVLRYVFNKSRIRDSSGKLLKYADAGVLLPKTKIGETGISLTWIEHFNCEKFNENLHEASKSLSNSLVSGRRVRSAMSLNSLFAYIRIKDIADICSQFGIELEITHTPSRRNSGHVTMEYLKDGDYLFRGNENEKLKHEFELNPMFHRIVKSDLFVYITLSEIIENS